jgi:conserved oligomeric Golgi complex subunit 7
MAKCQLTGLSLRRSFRVELSSTDLVGISSQILCGISLHFERISIPAIFPDPKPTFSTLITSVLSALQPKFSQRLESLFNHYGTLALKEMMTIYRATEEFATSIDHVMEKIVADFPSSIDNQGSPDPKSTRRQSKSSILGSEPSRSSFTGFRPLGLDWDEELFQPFFDF